MKRSTRRRLTNGFFYALFLAVVVLVALLADWTKIKANFFAADGWKWTDGNLHDLVTVGVKNTVVYTLIAFGVGFALALVLALAKLSPLLPYRWVATAYIELFRALPALVVILFMAFGVPIAFNWNPPGGPIGAGLIGLILVAAAYMAETIRAGIQAVPKGQVEAARSLGMTGPRTMVSIVLPQALRIVVPPLTNEFVLLIKDTALLFVVGNQASQREITTVAQDFLSSGPTAGTATSLLQAALLYVAITLPLTQLVAALERRQRRSR